MRKINFFVIFLVIAAFAACTFPESVEIKGNPELTVPLTFNVSSLFTDLIDDMVSDMGGKEAKLIQCTNSELESMTYIIKVDVSELLDDADLSELENGFKLGQYTGIPELVKVPCDWPIVYASIARDPSLAGNNKIDEKTLEDFGIDAISDLLHGLKFTGIKAKMYVSKSTFAESIGVAINQTITGTPPSFTPADIPSISAKYSDAAFEWGETYGGLDLPAGGVDIPLGDLLNGEVPDFTFDLIIRKNTRLEDLSDAANSKIELVIWLPLKLTAKDPGGADLDISELMKKDDGGGTEPAKDLFGRGGEDSGKFDLAKGLKSMQVLIGLNVNPFENAELHLTNPNTGKPGSVPIDIVIPMGSGTALNFAVDSLTMDKINNPANIPFAPEIKIHFPYNYGLFIPKLLKTTTINIKAELDYIISISNKEGV